MRAMTGHCRVSIHICTEPFLPRDMEELGYAGLLFYESTFTTQNLTHRMRKQYIHPVLIVLITASAAPLYAEECTNCITLEKMHEKMLAATSPVEHYFLEAHSTSSSNLETVLNESVVHLDRFDSEFKSPSQPGFRETLERSFIRVAERNALSDIYLPAAKLHWMSDSMDGYGVHKDFALSGRNLFLSAFKNGGRDTLADTLPTDAWANWAGNLFRWSLRSDHIGSTYDRAAPSASDLGWWSNNKLEYGIDPWGLDAFARVSLGNNGPNSLTGDKPIAVVGVDYRYDPLTQGRFRLHIVIPLPYSWEMNAGCTVDGKNIAAMDPSSFSYAARIQHVVGSGTRFKSLFYIGMQSNEEFLPKDARSSGPAFAVGLDHSWSRRN